MRVAFNLSLIALGVVISGDGCVSSDHACPDSCTVSGSATFWLACNPNDLVSVEATGPCSMPDEPLSWYTGAATKWAASVFAASPGTCHIVLTFATGFTYSADVTFASMNDNTPGCPPCPAYIGAISGGFNVNNPPETCVALDAGAAGDASDAEFTDTGAD